MGNEKSTNEMVENNGEVIEVSSMSGNAIQEIIEKAITDMLYDDHCREQLIKKGTEFKIKYERIPSSEEVLETILE